MSKRAPSTTQLLVITAFALYAALWAAVGICLAPLTGRRKGEGEAGELLLDDDSLQELAADQRHHFEDAP